MNCVRVTALTLAFSLLGAAAMAADPPKPRKFKNRAAGEAYFMQMDVTKTGMVSREIWVKNGLAIEKFTEADVNKDGKVDKREFLILFGL